MANHISNVIRFTYRKSATDLSYEVQRNSARTDSSNWLPVSSPEVDNGTHTVEVPASLTADFLRLKVNAP